MADLLPVQIVFQGGGAKLAALMAVCDVLRKYDGEQIKITRVAGSSAGAIAAVMLASRIPIETYKSGIKAIGQRYLPLMHTSPLWGGFRVITGSPYFSKIKLEDIFEGCFAAMGAQSI